MVEPIGVFEHKRIVLGVTGSVAAYKAVTVASHMTQAGALVDTILTEAAAHFVAPLSFEAVTGRPARTSMWDAGEETHITHVELGRSADLMLVAPATAHTLARLAHGMADDLLSVTALAARCPLAVAPAMDVGMFDHPAVQANLATLEARGAVIIGPAEGRMASGLVGRGRMVEPEAIIGRVRYLLGRGGPLRGRRVVVTAGPTREPLDPVRFITNWSSGKQGLALAQAALDHGASVTLIAGPIDLPAPVGAEVVHVITTEEMLEAVLAHIAGADVLLMAAAPVDFRPVQVAAQKIKKDGDRALPLTRTPDILSAVGQQRAQDGWPKVLVGFAAESENVIENARAKLERKALDLIAANDVTAEGAGFRHDTNRVTLLDEQGGVAALPLMSKSGVAEAILKRVEALLRDRDQPGVSAPADAPH
ncbi:MAG: bifunctional phosphopantothenoylcysteine decarboxylase/phosphopantothenate--cysteine ligase CoaBC [Anaerolineae bacterium]|nr:bifunctional phosphopantothenoylcysteine decarboxylase/phosphopantothenate--cysteine ligase CoaBC [Anaerolineae bacterium]